MKVSQIEVKSFEFAVRIVNLYKYLREDKREFILSKQIMRSGTSIGANVREAKYGESKADFVHKLAIALKEANETEYWLQLMVSTGYITQKQFDDIEKDITDLLKMLTAIIKSSKEGMKRRN